QRARGGPGCDEGSGRAAWSEGIPSGRCSAGDMAAPSLLHSPPMAWKPAPEMLLAPSASGGGAALRLPGAQDPPPPDERLVEPETRWEMVRGRRVMAQPAGPPHGDRHF